MLDNKLTSQYVTVANRFLRSINLSNDWRHKESNQGYIVTQNVALALDRIYTGLSARGGQRAYTLIGPYGTGKSAFGVFLCHLLSKDKQVSTDAQLLLSVEHQHLGKKYNQLRSQKENVKGFLPIIVTARKRPIAQILLEGLSKAISELNNSQSVQDLARTILHYYQNDGWKDTAIFLNLFNEVVMEAKEQGFAGILLLVDEVGKTLEYALQDRDGGDIYIFQEIAEYANRQQNFSILFLIILHQMFDDYVELAEKTIRAEWTKVQERFQAIQFSESAAATIKMVAEALQRKEALPAEIEKAVDETLNVVSRTPIVLPVGLDKETFLKLARRSWPLHPTVLLAIPHLFRRLAQNERSIFSYLTSHEPYGFQEQLNRPIDNNASFILLHDLYAYLLANFEASLARMPHAKRLLEANDIINSRHNLSRQDYELIRTIAILNVLGEMCPIRATAKFLECATSQGEEIDGELEKLKQQSILTYRKLDGSFRVWEGSDVDLDERMKEARRHLHMEANSLLETLRRHLPDRIFVARRHALETGAQRYFNVEYIEHLENEAQYEIAPKNGAAGTILVLLPSIDTASLGIAAQEVTKEQPRLIIAIPKQIEALRNVVEEVACLRWVERNTQELRDDRVARRELSFRLAEGEQRISQLLQNLLDPRPAPAGNSCQWYWNGQNRNLISRVQATKLLSSACDYIYSQSPRIRNELIARKSLSSAASAARRNLLERMLTSAELPYLGIDGFPPERSVYDSVLRASEMHVFDQDNSCWRLQAPPAENRNNLRPCWEKIEHDIFSPQIKRVELADIFSYLAEAPYGLPEGIHPILFTAFYVCYQEYLFLYREGSFIPDPQIAHFELLQRRPDLFSVSGTRTDGIRQAVVTRLSKGLNTSAKTVSVIRALFRIINSLPTITLKSNKLGDKSAISMRDIFLTAQFPEELLFTELPKCFGMKPFLANEERNEEIELFFNKLNHCLSVLYRFADSQKDFAQSAFLQALHLAPDNNGWIELERRASFIGPRLNNPVLTPLINAILSGMHEKHNPIPVLSYIAKRSFEQWSDLDIERFPSLASGIGHQFRQAWLFYGDMGEELSQTEIQQKNEVLNALEMELNKFSALKPTAVLVAAIKDLLKKFEQR